jgi:hypothetical protein
VCSIVQPPNAEILVEKTTVGVADDCRAEVLRVVSSVDVGETREEGGALLSGVVKERDMNGKRSEQWDCMLS